MFALSSVVDPVVCEGVAATCADADEFPVVLVPVCPLEADVLTDAVPVFPVDDGELVPVPALSLTHPVRRTTVKTIRIIIAVKRFISNPVTLCVLSYNPILSAEPSENNIQTAAKLRQMLFLWIVLCYDIATRTQRGAAKYVKTDLYR